MAQPSFVAADPLVGTTINDRFKILSVIAKGGMGKVYKAEQAPLGRIVAVKVLHPNYAGEGDPEFSKRFALEASVVSRLKHPNTVTVYDYGTTTEGVYFMAMELLEGKTLHRLIRDEGALDVGRALHILVQVARSLREAHGQGVIHRDLKPANIFLIHHDDDADFVKVLDFGLVKTLDENDTESLTKTGLFMGSPKYMAPEQIRGDKVTSATDVYALGVILFEMVAGKVPYDRPNSANLLLAHVNEPVPSLGSVNPIVSVPLAVEEIIYRAMAKVPEERFQSMDELIAAIKHSGIAVAGLGPSLTGEFHHSLSAPRATTSSGESLRAKPPPLPGQVEPAPTLSESIAARRSQPSGALTAPPTIEATPEAPRNPVLFALLGVGLLLVVAITYVITRRNGNDTVEPGHTTVAAPTPPPSTVSVVLESDPSGAQVFEGDVVVGHTPLRETWNGERGDPARAHTFTFRAPGHADAIVTLTGATLVHLARLQRIEAPPAARDAGVVGEGSGPSRTRVPLRTIVQRNARTRDGGATPSGYRRDPYGP
jgi:serine/threonine-protein kinase